MQKELLSQAESYVKKNNRRHIWKRLVGGLACIVVFCTTYALILPAITMENQLICGMEEHSHGEACYETMLMEQFMSAVICQPEIHQHTAECFDDEDNEGKLICGLADQVIHIHDANCFDADGLMICNLPETEEHIHDDSCFSFETTMKCAVEEEYHLHGETCFRKTQGELICQPEEPENHEHGDACYEQTVEVICGVSENPDGHLHGEDCYETVRNLSCQLEQIAIHTHDEFCVDENGLWNCGILAAFEHQHVTECLMEIPVAPVEQRELMCQLAVHAHAAECYPEMPGLGPDVLPEEPEEKPEEEIVEEDPVSDAVEEGVEDQSGLYFCATTEHLHGEGCWDENSVFCCELVEHFHDATCLIPPQTEEPAENYLCGMSAHIHEETCFDQDGLLICFMEEHIHEAECLVPIQEEPIEENYPCGKVSHIHEETCFDRDGLLICFMEEHIHEAECLVPIQEEPIEENYPCGKVSHIHEENCFDHTGLLICVMEEHTHSAECMSVTAQIFTDGTYLVPVENDTTVITIAGDLPEGAVIKAFPVEMEADENAVLAYDITIFRADGTIFEPDVTDTLYVSIQSGSLTDASDMELEVCHVPDGGEPEPIEATVAEGQVFFNTNHFSVYMVRAVVSSEITDYTKLKNAIINGSQPEIALGANMVFDGVDTIVIPAGKTVVLNLNGYKIQHRGNGSLFSIPSGASLKIIDGAAAEPDVKRGTGSLYGNAAAVSGENEITLTYYVTESQVDDLRTGATDETLQKYTVTCKGAIVGTNQPVVSVSGGTFELSSGMLYGGTNRAVYQTNGVTTLSGGYICGFKDVDYGGAIRCNGGRLNISGTVLAGNEAVRGGAVYANSAEVNITGGVISGNTSTYTEGSDENATHYGGGGLYLNNSPTTMSDGYVTNNKALATGYFDGGGGILVCGSNTPFTLKGGYITGNTAYSGGGIRTNWKNSVKLVMEGGFVCSNIATGAEGGGISLNMNGTGLVTGGYINNNQTKATQHWGGGGLFGATGSNLYVRNVLITDNSAGGFGGGIGGCSTGRVYVCVNEGAAVYSNAASGQNTSGGASTKNEDQVYALNNKIFMNNGYQDYFCALNSVVEGAMLGGHAANWDGSADGAAVRAGREDTLIAAYVMGLTSDPTEAAKAAAVNLAQVFINGNDSYTHGGGILCNGYMIIGETDRIEVGARIELQASKEFLSSDSIKQKMKEGQFTFQLIDANTNAVLATASNDVDGNIIFKERIPFFATGTFVYYIQEVPGKDGRVVYDSTVYRLTVDVTDETGHFDTIQINGQNVDVYRTQYLLDALTVDKRNGGEEWIPVSRNENPSNSDSGAIKLQLTSGPTFTNVQHKNINIEVKKLWDDENAATRPASVTVSLNRNGTAIENGKVTLSGANNWYHKWTNLPTVSEDGTEYYTYTVTEDPVPGYVPEYEVITNHVKTGYWIPATSIEVGERYAIISPDHQYALYMTDEKANADLTTNEKRKINAESVTIDGVTYEYAIPDGELQDRSIFHAGTTNAHNNERIILRNLGINGNSWLLAEDNDKDGNWLKGCNNADYASGVIYENGISIQRQWDKNNERRYLTFANGKFNSSESSGENNALLYRYVYAGNITSSSLVQITNRSTGVVTYTLDITKISGINSDMLLAGAEFQLLDSAGAPLSFVMTTAGAYVVAPESVEGAVQTLATNREGKLVLRGLNAGDYVLRETKAPADHMPIADMMITLGEPDASDHISLTLPLTIVDPPLSYELPETGGSGTQLYTMGGLLMITAAGALLLYSNKKRRKEDQPSF